MSVRPTDMSSPLATSTDLLDLVTRLSTEIGAITDSGALSERIIEELCRAGATTHGALYLLDREHDCFRRAGIVGEADGFQHGARRRAMRTGRQGIRSVATRCAHEITSKGSGIRPSWARQLA